MGSYKKKKLKNFKITYNKTCIKFDFYQHFYVKNCILCKDFYVKQLIEKKINLKNECSMIFTNTDNTRRIISYAYECRNLPAVGCMDHFKY